MPDRLHPDLAELAAAVQIVSPTEYRMRGEPRVLNLSPATEGGGEVDMRALLVAALEGEIYSRLYVRPATDAGRASGTAAQRDFIGALSAANGGAGCWEPGWRVVGVEEDGRVAVSRDAVTFWTGAEGVRTTRGALCEGDFCRVRVAKELRHLLTGFYCAIGNGAGPAGGDETDRLVRVYWHLTAAIAVDYMSAATTLLNRARIPFRTKVLSDPAAYGRADAGVLYLERRHFAAARPAVAALQRRFAGALRPEVPMFTRALAPGVGVAEDPGGGQSFGQARAATAARAFWQAHLRGETDEPARLEALTRGFREEGLDPARPHLCPGSDDVYDLLPARVRTGRTPRRRAAALPGRGR
jgi:HopA1 effector protein family